MCIFGSQKRRIKIANDKKEIQTEIVDQFDAKLDRLCAAHIEVLGVGSVSACLVMLAAELIAASDDDEFIDRAIQVFKDNTITYYNLKTRKWLVK